MQLFLYLRALCIQFLDALAQFLHLRQNRGDILACLLQLRDRFGYFILLRLHRLNLADDVAALLVKRQNRVDLLVVALAAHGKARLTFFHVFTDKFYI